jgi:hypothetical protein
LKLIRYISILTFALILLTATPAQAQRRGVMNLPNYNHSKYHFGFILALNQMHFTVQMNEGFQRVTYDSLQSPDIFADSLRLLNVESKPTIGFTVGIVGNLKLGKYFDLRLVPSLAFGERSLDYYMAAWDDGQLNFVEIRKSVTSAHIVIPLHIRYRSKRVHNFGAYVLGGAKYVLDLAATRAQKKEDDNETLVKLRKHDIAAEIGAGFEFYNAWFKFGIEVKMSYGLFDLLQDENNIYTGGIASLKSKVWQISFTFE